MQFVRVREMGCSVKCKGPKVQSGVHNVLFLGGERDNQEGGEEREKTGVIGLRVAGLEACHDVLPEDGNFFMEITWGLGT